MKRLLPYIAFACLTGFTAISGLPVMAGGCSNHMNKTVKIDCAEDDTDCKNKKAEKYDFKKSIKS